MMEELLNILRVMRGLEHKPVVILLDMVQQVHVLLVIFPTITAACVGMGNQIYRELVQMGALRSIVSAIIMGVHPQYVILTE